jgi:LPPG:FO 2-phospho-L-lactate transferase
VRGEGGRIAVLCGGLGGSRCVDALARAAGPEAIAAIGNVGDDLEILGVHVSPDLDTVLYTLAGLLDEERGWGVRDETYSALATVRDLGGESWFTLGDRDIGLHLVRTSWLREGLPLSEATRRLALALDVSVRLLPASDEPVRTKIQTREGELDFQEWFVARGHRDEVTGVRYEGAEAARPAPGVLEAIDSAELAVIAPSNPFVSIEPILAVPGIREAVAAKRVAAVSPLVGGKAFRGPLAEMMASLGHEPSPAGVAKLYGGLLDVFVVAPGDEGPPGAVECDIDMVAPHRRAEVGQKLLEALL